MHSRITLAAVHTYFAITQKLGCIPFTWDSVNYRLSVKVTGKTVLVLGFYYFWTSLYLANTGLSLWNSVRGWTNPMKTAFDLFYFMHFLCDFSFSIAIVLTRNTHAAFLTSIFEFDRALTRIDNKTRHDGAVLLWLCVTGIGSVATVATAFSAVNFRSTRFLYHRLPLWLQNYATFTIWCCLEYSSHMLNISSISLYVIEATMYPPMINFWLGQVTVRREILQTSSISRFMTEIQVLNSLANDCLSKWFFPMLIALLVVNGTVGLYGCVMLYGQVPLKGYVMFPLSVMMGVICILQIFPKAGLMASGTSNASRVLMLSHPGKVTRRVVKATPPLHLSAGFAFRLRYPSNWRLGITNVNKRDEGEYRCQLSTHPPKTLTFHLKVIAPAVLILDENGNAITERHYKEDSSLHLTCKASHLDQPMDKVAWYKGDRILPGGDSRIKVKLWKNGTNGEASAFLSVLSVRRGDSGNYTCRASPTATNTIAVHVLNGELPAAVQHENHGTVLLGSMSWSWSLLGLVSLAWTSLT